MRRLVRPAIWVLAASLLSCGADVTTQTVLRFSASDALTLPSGTMLRLRGFRHGERQHTAGRDLGTYEFRPDIKLPVDATDNDGSRRFTVFAELVSPEGTRLSWARVRSGFVQDALSEVRVEFAAGCPAPSDQQEQAPDYDITNVCGSHDTCRTPDGSGSPCVSACVAPEPFEAGTLAAPSEQISCPLEDDLPVESLEAGWSYMCAMGAGEAFCWGEIAFASKPGWRQASRIMRPDGRTTYDEEPVVTMSASIHVACALMESGEIRCGGNNRNDAFGMPVSGDVPCCTVLPDVAPAADVDVYNFYICIVTREEGDLWCSGNVPGIADQPTFARYVSGEFMPTGLSTLHGGAYLLSGYGTDGFQWISTVDLIDTSTVPPPREQAREIASTTESLCVVTTSGELLCWGEDALGTRFDPQPANLGTGWRHIATAEHSTSGTSEVQPHRCGIREDGTLWCWGDDAYDKLGAETAGPVSFEDRVQVGADADWIDVATGENNTCGIRQGGHVYCWGRNHYGQLGSAGGGTSTPRHTPVPRW